MSPRAGLDVSSITIAAADIANEEGLEQVTLAKVARKLGVRSPSLYNHIGGLPDLIEKLAVYGVEKMHTVIKYEMNSGHGENGLKAVMTAYLTFARAEPGVYEAAQKAPEQHNEVWQAASNQLVQVLLAVVAAFDLEEKAALHTVRVLRSALHGFVMLDRAGGFGLPLDLQETEEVMYKLITAGIAKL